MDAVEKKIVSNYLGLLRRLSPAMKLSLIDQLSKTMKGPTVPTSKMKSAFGGWASDEPAEELIEQIRSSRFTKRQIERS